MNFFKKLFGKNTTPPDKDISNINPVSVKTNDIPIRKPKAAQGNNVPDIEPISKQAVEYIFKGSAIQKKALKSIQEFKRERNSANPKTILALLSTVMAI